MFNDTEFQFYYFIFIVNCTQMLIMKLHRFLSSSKFNTVFTKNLDASVLDMINYHTDVSY